MSDFLAWQSSLSLEQVFSSSDSFSYPVSYGGGFFYLTQLKNEKSRSALMFSKDGETRCVTPAPFNLRTKVSEYGGKPFWLFGDQLYFANQADQCLYKQTITTNGDQCVLSEPQRVSPKATDDAVFMYTDLVKVSDSLLLCIIECAKPSKADENKSYLATMDVNQADKAPVVVEQGADFYSNLVFSKQTNAVAWVQWQHPAMPWDANQLYTAQITVENGDVSILDKSQVELDQSASVCQLLFANNGALFFSADFNRNVVIADGAKDSKALNSSSDFWNVYCYEHSKPDAQAIQVTKEILEFGYPHWQYGDARIVQYNESTLLTVGSAPSGDQLFLIDQDTLAVKPMLKTNSTIQSLSSNANGSALMVELPADKGARLVQFENHELNKFESQVLLKNEIPLSADNVSLAEHIGFTTKEGDQAFGFYYPPTNSDYVDAAFSSMAPPLIVMVHGGPTARAYGHFDIQKQFWTSRGFALFDVNHRGSSGYGRVYRDALYDQWGEVDCQDIIDGIEHLIDQGKADANSICIRGKSAGGYAVLRALTEHPEVFKVGACYYGIGNLATLADTTHKFEKHYADRLIGEEYDEAAAKQTDSRFYQRSPIHKVSQLKSAMIVFQGLQDKVVPPEVAHEVVSVLKQSGVDHEYVEYSDEAHGFRQVNNNIDAWTKELAFYRRVLAN